MSVKSNKDKTYCPVCGTSKCKNLNAHFYKLFVCSKCEHGFNDFPESSCWDYRFKYLAEMRKREKHLIQSTPTEKYKIYRQETEQRKIKLLERFVSANSSVLDCNAEDGTFLRNIRDKVRKASGICYDKTFENCWMDIRCCVQSLSDVKSKSYDTIIMVDFLEFCYSLYETMIEAFRVLKPGGVIIIEVPIGCHPLKDYQARFHDFSRKSIQKFAHKVSDMAEVSFEKSKAQVLIKTRIENTCLVTAPIVTA